MIAEVVMALALHVARRLFGERPETPLHALRIIRDRGLISPQACDELVRLRNLLVHRYWVVDDELVYRSVKEDFRAVRELVDAVRRVAGGG